MKKFRKRPVVIEAARFTWEEGRPVADGDMFLQWPVQVDDRGVHLTIPTLEGDHRANVGDWIIKGVEGEFYPCKHEIFEKTYLSMPDEP